MDGKEKIEAEKKEEQAPPPIEGKDTLGEEVSFRDSQETADRAGKQSSGEMIQISESEYQKLTTELNGYQEKYLRLYADFENARKRMEREKMEFVKYAHHGIIEEFLNILDDLERSVQAANAKHQDYAGFLKGVEMVMTHIYEMLKKQDVSPMEVVGKKFDPHCHEAFMQVETDECEEGVVTEELQKGYLLGDRVIRTAKVKVAKKK